MDNRKWREIKQQMGFLALRTSALIIFIILGILLYFLFVRGIKVINWGFLTKMPENGMTSGGIFPAILGTFYLTMGAILFALPLGIMAAIYMTEYAVQGKGGRCEHENSSEKRNNGFHRPSRARSSA